MTLTFNVTTVPMCWWSQCVGRNRFSLFHYYIKLWTTILFKASSKNHFVFPKTVLLQKEQLWDFRLGFELSQQLLSQTIYFFYRFWLSSSCLWHCFAGIRRVILFPQILQHVYAHILLPFVALETIPYSSRILKSFIVPASLFHIICPPTESYSSGLK